jgi:TRAP-type C4-dicarboxylate transport system permease small subunit
MMRKALDRMYLASGYLAGLFLVVTFVIVLAQVILNLMQIVLYEVAGVPFKMSIPSYAEFATYSFAAASFLGLGYTFRSGGHIRVMLLSIRLPLRFRPWLELWCVGCALVMSLYFAYFAIDQVVTSFQFGDVSSGLIPVQLWLPQSGMAAGLTILAIALIDELSMVLLKCIQPIQQAAVSQTGDGGPLPWLVKPGNLHS